MLYSPPNPHIPRYRLTAPTLPTGFHTFKSETGDLFEYPLGILARYSSYFNDLANLNISNGVISLETTTRALFWVLSNADEIASPAYGKATAYAVKGINTDSLPDDDTVAEIMTAAQKYDLLHIFGILVKKAYLGNEDEVDPMILYALSCFNAGVNGPNDKHILWCTRVVQRANNLRRAFHIPSWSRSSNIVPPVSYHKIEEFIHNWRTAVDNIKSTLLVVALSQFQSPDLLCHLDYEINGKDIVYYRVILCPFNLASTTANAKAFLKSVDLEMNWFIDQAARLLPDAVTPSNGDSGLPGPGLEACWLCRGSLNELMCHLWNEYGRSKLGKLSLDR